MSRKPIWVRNDVVIAVHGRQIAEHGGQGGIRDEGLLESALKKPLNLYLYSQPKATISMLAASYAFGISKNHPFVDGNKRTAFTVCMLFLSLNDKYINASQEEKFKTFMKLALGKLTEIELAKWIEKHLTNSSKI